MIRGRGTIAGVLTLTLTAFALVVSATPARAHGGAFGPPPAPATPRSRGPGGGSVGPPSHVDPGFGGPIVTPGSGGAVTPRRASKRKTPVTPTFETSWQLWWNLNRPALLPLRRMGAVAPAPDGGTGPLRPPGEGWEAARARLTAEQVVPFLLAVLAPDAKHKADVKASALLALGRIAVDPAAIEVLFRHLEDVRAPNIVRESAALGLGFLRRSDPKRQFAVRHLEPTRARLLQVFDQWIDGKKSRVPLRTRAFAMFALGMLGDQPFSQDPHSKDGRLLLKLMWQRMAVPYPDRDLHIALLAAIGLQPRAGIPDGVIEGVRGIVRGRNVLDHKWDVFKRAHAVTALARLGGPSNHAMILKLANDKRSNVVLRLAAAIALSVRAAHFAPAERSAAVRVLTKTFVLEQELLGVGLANVALGRMVGADLRAGSTRVLDFDKADDLLVQRAENAPWYLRGFAALGLALAAREGDPGNPRIARFRARARGLLLKMARTQAHELGVRGAGAVGLGLLADETALPVLRALVPQAALDAELRGHAALALGQIGKAESATVRALADVVAARGPDVVRNRAALGLSLLGAREATRKLIEQLDDEASTRRLAAVTRALGRLGDLSAAEPLLALAARTDVPELVQAMAVVSLGRLLDPEPRSSLLRLTGGVCYPARSKAFQEAFTIL